jgi:hypothetical protein
MQHNLDDTVALLTRTPAALDALLRGLPDTWVRRNEGGDSWTATEIVAHLIHAERTDWMPRVRMTMEFGETRDFEPFDRLGHLAISREHSLDALLDLFAREREEGLRELRALDLSDLENKRGRHPAFGAVSLSQLLATWAAHDLSHLHQLTRVMAHQYREPVGPWAQYLGVMQCQGHSS